MQTINASFMKGPVFAVYTLSPSVNGTITVTYELVHGGKRYTPVLKGTNEVLTITHTQKSLTIAPRQVETGITKTLEDAGLSVRKVIPSDSALAKVLIGGTLPGDPIAHVHLERVPTHAEEKLAACQ